MEIIPLLTIGKLLPSYHAADMEWLIANGQIPTRTNPVVLVAWTLVFLLLATLLAPRGEDTLRDAEVRRWFSQVG